MHDAASEIIFPYCGFSAILSRGAFLKAASINMNCLSRPARRERSWRFKPERELYPGPFGKRGAWAWPVR
ncbi:MAG: hypothetical protein LBW85_02735, partial [Deltaproteobacteria bacterium]|nr:hypothetical protein [Deltaproteobacteria bacterium]